MSDIFLSYSGKDTGIMQSVKYSLHDAGFQVWTIDIISPGTPSWRQVVEAAITGAECFVCILSPDSLRSRRVRAELDFAEMHRKPIYLILARGTEIESVPFGYASHKWIDIRNPLGYSRQMQELITTISVDQATIMAQSQRASRVRSRSRMRQPSSVYSRERPGRLDVLNLPRK